MVADPAEDDAAAALTQALGFLPRSPERRGTSIMIIDPIFLGNEGEAPETLMGMVGESLLWHLWPRLMADTDPAKKISAHLELDGQHFPLPAPEDFPPLDNFAAAMREIRNGGASVEKVRSKGLKKDLGRLAIRKGVWSPRQRLVPKELSQIPETASHIALMRPVELVVRYYDDEPLPDSRVEWAGVFISDRDPEVEEAFAQAEPPTHDDWQSKFLPKGRQQTIVNVALRQIKEAARAVAAPSAGAQGAGDGGPTLARVSGQFGRLLDAASGQGAGPERRTSPSLSARKKNRISTPVFLKLEATGADRIAVFETTVHHDGVNPALTAVARPMLVVDGGAAPDGSWAARAPQVVSWSQPDGTIVSESGTLLLDSYSGDLEIRVAIPDDCAVTVKAALEDNGRSAE
jgi:hypothetical protein